MVATISALTLGQEEYHLSLAREDYYLEGHEPAGHWLGGGAKWLGLEGKVTATALRHLFRGYSANGTHLLVRNAGAANRQPAWDVTFSAPKSVSVLWALAPDDMRGLLEAAHEHAVTQALAYLEQAAGFTRRGSGGEQREPAKLVVAAFRHHTSRAQDPQLHTHCLVLNVGVRDDHSTGTIESRELYRHKMAAGALYRSSLSAFLERDLGLPCVRRNTWFEVAGIPESVLKAFAQRRTDIEAALEMAGQSGAKAAAVAALTTREAKQLPCRDELFRQWQGTALAHGFTRQMLHELVGQTWARDPEHEQAASIREAVTALTDRQAHFSRADLVRGTAEAAQGRGLDATQVLVAVERALHTDLVPLGRVQGTERFTTTAMVTLERALLDQVEAGYTSTAHRVDAAILTAVRERFPTLTAEQVQALVHVTQGDGAVQVVSGMAGTGKTFLLAAARDAWQRQGLAVLGAALAGKAAHGLEEGAGIPSRTVHRLLAQLDSGSLQITPRMVLVLDEAGMVGTKQLEHLVRKVVTEGGGKLVLVGDVRQLQSIEAGGGLAALSRRLGTAELREITRQQEAWARAAVGQFAEGDSQAALAQFASRGLLTVAQNADQALSQLVAGWRDAGGVENPRDHLILAGGNREVTILNRLAQEERCSLGLVTEPAVEVGNVTLHVGDRVLFTRNAQALGVKNGHLGEVTRIDPAEQTLEARLDSGQRVVLSVIEYPHLKLGYAVTVYKSQGMTVEHAYALVGGPTTDRELAYVLASRARKTTRLFTDVFTAGQELADLVQATARSRRKELAHEIAERELPVLHIEVPR